MLTIPPRGMECKHRGEMTRYQECPSCKGKVKISVYQCNCDQVTESECVMRHKVARLFSGVASCQGCDHRKDYEQCRTDRSSQRHEGQDE